MKKEIYWIKKSGEVKKLTRQEGSIVLGRGGTIVKIKGKGEFSLDIYKKTFYDVRNTDRIHLNYKQLKLLVKLLSGKKVLK